MKAPGTRCQGGSALIVTLAVAGVIGIALASGLYLVSEYHRSVVRSNAWNTSMALIEAGVEEALTHIHRDGMTNLASNGWTPMTDYKLGEVPLSGLFYLKDRKFDGGYYAVGISAASPPVIYSAGFGRIPMKNEYLPARIVRVRTRSASLFRMAVAAGATFELNGHALRTDSFDSTDPARSTNGRYDRAKFGDQGHIAASLGIASLFSQGSADIHGRVVTGPGGTIHLGANGSAGSKTWVQSRQGGVEPGYFKDDMNRGFSPVVLPFSGDFTIPEGNPISINSSGHYQLPSLTQSLLVRSNVQAVLLVIRAIQIGGQDGIVLEPGASLKLYMAGADAVIGGKGVANASGNASNFAYYGLPGNASITFSGSGEFAGTLYAPNADLKLIGSGAGVQEFIGATVSSSVTLGGSFNIHYDENLGKNGPGDGFVIVSWTEI